MEKNENGFSNLREYNRNDGCRANGAKEKNPPADYMRMPLGSGQGDCAAVQLAMVYSPFHCWRMLYSPEEALKRGTLFEELYKPLEDCTNE